MNRTNNSNYGTRAKHHDTQMTLLRLTADLRITIDAGEQIGAVMRQRAVAEIAAARRELDMCYEGFEDAIKYMNHIAEFKAMNHSNLVRWLNQLSMDLILMSIPDLPDEAKPNAVTVARLDEGNKLIYELDTCRQNLVFYR
jgi:hypothetical protein